MWRRAGVVVATGVATVVGALGLGACGSSPKPAAGSTTLPAPGAGAPTTVGAGGPGASGGTAPAATAAPPAVHLSWSACKGGQGPSGVQCATLPVPLDTTGTDAPASGASGGAGATVDLALDRIPATGTRIGSLITNPGGPGESAVDFLPLLARNLTSQVRQHFDIVGYDPPGVGHSDAVDCLAPPALAAYVHLDPSPPGPTGFAAVTSSSQAFATACREHSGPLLAHVSTLDAARDMDRVRAALGDARLDYLGFSYGTLLGATYASLFPTRVRAMVLDGALDPTLPPLTFLEQQGASVDAQFRTFAAACASAGGGCPWHPGSDPTGAFLALLGRVRSAPVPAGGGRVVGPAELLYGTADALYATGQWPTLERALAQVTAGSGATMVALFDQYVGQNADGTFETTVESETAVNCADSSAPSLPAIEAAAAAVAAQAPIFGGLDVDGEAVCAVWPAQGTAAPHALSAPGAPPIVVVGSTGDPITPYGWAQHLAAQLGSGVLLTRVGDGHTAYFASSCVRAAIQTYLVSLRPPATGTSCPSS